MEKEKTNGKKQKEKQEVLELVDKKNENLENLFSINPEKSIEKKQKKEKPKGESKKISGQIEKIIEKTELTDDFLIEKDGNFFWVIQRVFWSILKIGFVISAIIFLIWVIWDPKNNPLNKEKNKKEIIPQKTETPLAQKLASKKPITQTSITKKNIIESSLHWLSNTKKFFSVPAKNLITSQDPQIRKQEVEIILQKLQNFINDAKNINNQLTTEITSFSKNADIYKKETNTKESLILDLLKKFESININKLINEKISYDKLLKEQVIHINVRKILKNKIESYTKYLIQFQNNIITNKKAIIENIQVVDFPNDPFERVITPTEWKSK